MLGRRSIIDGPTALITATILGVLVWGRGRVPEPAVVLVAAVGGLVVQPVLA